MNMTILKDVDSSVEFYLSHAVRESDFGLVRGSQIYDFAGRL